MSGPATTRIRLALLATVAAMGRAQAGEPVTLELTRDGNPASVIVVAATPTRAAQLAAAELQEHIRKITGAILPVEQMSGVECRVSNGVTRILVGESAATRSLGLKSADFGSQEYLVRFTPDALVLMGRDAEDRGRLDYGNSDGLTLPNGYEEQGTCYAVYDFLERQCGVRWYLPTDLGTVFSPTGTLTVTGSERRRTPWMEVRAAGLESAPGGEVAGGYHRFPGDLIGLIYGKDSGLLSWREHVLFARRLRHGGALRSLGGHSFYGYYARFWDKDKPDNRFFEAYHPEYFAQGYEGRPPQMCYTSEALVQQTVKDARTFFDGKWRGLPGNNDEWPGQDYFPVGAQDTCSWCLCPACTAMLTNGVNEYFYAFVNRLAREVRKTHPGKMLSALDYNQYTLPPRLEKLEPNVAITMVLNPRRLWNTLEWAQYRKVMDAWYADRPQRPRYLWMHYLFPVSVASYANPYPYIDKPPAWYPFPGFFAHHVVEQMSLYHDLGFRGMTIETSIAPPSCQRLWLWDQLELYMTFQLAFDPDQDGNRLIDEFFERFYGAAAAPMRTFYGMVEEIYCNPNNYPDMAPAAQDQDPRIAWEYLGTEPRMGKLERLMNEARTACRTEVETQRVALFDKGIWQAMQKGRSHYVAQASGKDANLQSARAPRCAAPEGGDPRKVDWAQAGVLGNWRSFDAKATDRRLEGRIAHDGERLYLRLQEHTNTANLVRDPTLPVCGGDDWEVFLEARRTAYGAAYRQMAIDVPGRAGFWSHVPTPPSPRGWVSGATVHSDSSAPDCWSVYLALPLAGLLEGVERVKEGDAIYLNVIRATGGNVEGAGMWIPTLARSFHAPDRMGAVVLEKTGGGFEFPAK
jgi:hypothetical protein